MCNKCSYQVIDGVQVRVNGNVTDPEVQAAIEQMVKVARNYTTMKKMIDDFPKCLDCVTPLRDKQSQNVRICFRCFVKKYGTDEEE